MNRNSRGKRREKIEGKVISEIHKNIIWLQVPYDVLGEIQIQVKMMIIKQSSWVTSNVRKDFRKEVVLDLVLNRLMLHGLQEVFFFFFKFFFNASSSKVVCIIDGCPGRLQNLSNY